MKIGTKLLLSAGLAVLIGTAVSNVVAYRYFEAILREKLLTEQQYQLDTVTRQIERILEDQERVGAALSVEPRVQEYLHPGESYGTREVPRVLRVRNVATHLIYLLSLQKNIDHVTIIDSDGTEVWTMFPVTIFQKGDSSMPSDFNWPEIGEPKLLGPYPVRVRGEEIPYIGYAIPVHDVEQPSLRLGTLVLHLNLEAITKILAADTSSFEYAQAHLGEVLFWEKSAGVSDTDDGVEHIIRSDTVGGAMSLQAGISPRTISLSLRPVAMVFSGITLLSLIIYFLFLLPLLWRILRPLGELYQAVDRVAQGRLDEGPAVTSGDELQSLSEQFNRMLLELKEHIAGEVVAERRARQSEYDLLLSQINPHFLYNTLNSVKFLSRLEKRDAVDDVVDSLIEIMQKTVGKPGSLLMSTVEEELAIVKKYLLIQKHQYGDLFAVHYRVDKEVLPLKVPGFILQPLVENAIFHGIRPANRKGMITMIINRREDAIDLTVADDGVGMEPAGPGRGELARGENGRGGMKSIGLENIKNRLAFHYPGTHTFSIDTAPGKGFAVYITIQI